MDATALVHQAGQLTSPPKAVANVASAPTATVEQSCGEPGATADASDFERCKPMVFATDIDRACLQAASAGRFPDASFDDTKLGDLETYFSPCGDGRQVCRMIRDMVSFSYDDLTSEVLAAPSDSVFGSFDLILCRNVLIYFSPELQDAVLAKLSRALVSGGYLVLGEAESLGKSVAGQFKTIDKRNRIYRKR